MNFVDVITQCENAHGAGTKKEIFAALQKADTVTQALIHEALDPYRIFGVRKYEVSTFSKKDPENFSFIFDILNKLNDRELTGNAAKNAVSGMLSVFTENTASYISRILDKDLKAGFSAETFNKIFKDNKIPVFEVMLADKCNSPEEFNEKVSFPCQADVKYDGNRAICIVRKDQPVEYRARSGKISFHLNGLFDDDLASVRSKVDYDFIVDGESFGSDFTETMNAKKDGNDKAKQALRLRAFFMMPLSDWKAQNTKITMKQTREQLSNLLQGCSKVLLSEGREVSDYNDMITYCNEVIDNQKQEGLVLKNWSSTYKWDRTIDWCKVKRFYDVDARIVDWYPGRAKSRLENTCGGIIVEGKDENGNIFHCNVGSGFSDGQRTDIKNNFDSKYKFKTAVIKYQELTKAKNNEFASLRFPVFNYIRDDKTVDAVL